MHPGRGITRNNSAPSQVVHARPRYILECVVHARPRYILECVVYARPRYILECVVYARPRYILECVVHARPRYILECVVYAKPRYILECVVYARPRYILEGVVHARPRYILEGVVHARPRYILEGVVHARPRYILEFVVHARPRYILECVVHARPRYILECVVNATCCNCHIKVVVVHCTQRGVWIDRERRGKAAHICVASPPAATSVSQGGAVYVVSSRFGPPPFCSPCRFIVINLISGIVLIDVYAHARNTKVTQLAIKCGLCSRTTRTNHFLQNQPFTSRLIYLGCLANSAVNKMAARTRAFRRIFC